MKISILMINFNGQDTIERAVDSALGQTYEDIEVICVDDCSTDRSREILKKYDGDERFTLVCHEKNSGMTCGRVSGIEAATGDYCIFLDGDDELVPECCSILAETVKEHDCDIIGYGAEVKFTVIVSEDTVLGMNRSFSQLEGELSPDGLLEAIYDKKTVKETLWSKCYRASFLKRALKYIKKDYINLCEDYYFTFVTSRLASSYYGIEDRLLYYYVGSGVSTVVQAVSPTGIERNIASVLNSFKNCKAFIEEYGAADKYCTHVLKHERELIYVFMNKIKMLDSEEDKLRIARLMIEKFGVDQFVSSLAESYWEYQNGAMEILDFSKLFPSVKKPFKTVAIYAPQHCGGDTERDLALMARTLREQGLGVVVITDGEDGGESELPCDVQRICLNEKYPVENGDGYAERFPKLYACLSEFDVDAVIYGFDSSDYAPWDMLTVKSTGAFFVPYVHTTFIKDLFEGCDKLLGRQCAYRYADAVLTLTQADKIFWSRINGKTFLVQPFRPAVKISAPTGAAPSKKILWVDEADCFDNNPMDPLYVFYRVLQTVPEATLCMCGRMSEPVEKLLSGVAKSLHLRDKVTFAGELSDPDAVYKDAAVVLKTSNSVGYSHGIFQSLSYGVPVVLYELPRATYGAESEAIISLPFRSYDTAAKAIVDVISDPSYREGLSAAAIRVAQSYGEQDYGAMLRSLITRIENGECEELDRFDAQAVYELCDAASLAFSQTNVRIKAFEKDLYDAQMEGIRKKDELERSEAKARMEYNELSDKMSEIYRSRTFRFGQRLTYIPRKFRGLRWLLKHRGIKYTVKHVCGKTAQDPRVQEQESAEK